MVIKSSSQRLQSFLACSSPMTCNGPYDFLYVFMRSFWHNEGMQQFITQISFLQFLHPPVFCPMTGFRKWLNSSDSSYSRCSTCRNSRKWYLIFHPACFRTQKDIKVLIELLVRSLSILYDTVKFAFFIGIQWSTQIIFDKFFNTFSLFEWRKWQIVFSHKINDV